VLYHPNRQHAEDRQQIPDSQREAGRIDAVVEHTHPFDWAVKRSAVRPDDGVLKSRIEYLDCKPSVGEQLGEFGWRIKR